MTFTENKKKAIKRVNLVEKWVNWRDLSKFNNKFEIGKENSGCISVNLVKREYKIEK